MPWAGLAGCWGDTARGNSPTSDDTSSNGKGTGGSGSGGQAATGGSAGDAGTVTATGGRSNASGGMGVGGGEPPDPCDDAERNYGETDTDCGGASDCRRCEVGERCSADSDCFSEYCASNVCEDASCSDGIQNQSETDIDCGGNCTPDQRCESGMSCAVDGDCETDACADDVCVERCESGKRELDETDIDCGGSVCGPCADGERCEISEDCQSRICVADVCAPARCDDGVMNGDETDVDCGGSCPFECLIGDDCMRPSDCQSEVCTEGGCVADLEIVGEDVIDDFEDADQSILANAGRAGNWARFGDPYGEATLTIASISGQRASSLYALHYRGGGFTAWGSGSFVDLDNSGGQAATKKPYNLSGFSGITFWARSETELTLSVALPDINTDTAGDHCSTCDHHWYAPVSIDSEWRRYVVEFDHLVLEAGTVPTPESFDAASVFSVQFKVASGLQFDVMLDDLALVR